MNMEHDTKGHGITWVSSTRCSSAVFSATNPTLTSRELNLKYISFDKEGLRNHTSA